MKLIKQDDIDEVEEKYFYFFGHLVPRYSGLTEEDYLTEWYVDGVNNAIDKKDPSLVYKEFEKEDVIY